MQKESILKNTTPANTVALIQKDSNFVSLDLAMSAAKQVNNSRLVSSIIAKQAVNGLNLSAAKQILDNTAVPDNVNPSYYIINYLGGGYVVIPADKRVEPIISFSNTGYFPHSGTLPTGLIKWLSVNHKNMQLLRKNAAIKAPAGVARLWTELAVVPATGTKVLDKALPPPPPCQDTWSTYTVGPFLTTTWAQGYPYDLLCPSGAYSYSQYGNLAPAGCVATAMAQIMYYWKFPTTYKWSIMPLTSNYSSSYASNTAVAQLVKDVGRSVGMVYGSTESAPGDNGFPFYSSISCTTALKNTFHYGSSTEASFDYLKVVSNLDAREPVLLAASTDLHTFLGFNTGSYNNGHEWVCDGYQQVTFTGCPGEPVLGESWLYFDMNWGWNEAGVPYNVDGWFDFNYWSVNNYGTVENYIYNESMTYNIHP